MDNDRLFPSGVIGNNLRFCAHVNPASASAIGLHNARSPVDLRPRREIWPGNVLHQLID